MKVFQQAHQLNFGLLSDASAETVRKYGVPLDQDGSISRKIGDDEITLERSYTVSRWTFIIDKKGKIVYKDMEVEASEDSQKGIEFLKNVKRRAWRKYLLTNENMTSTFLTPNAQRPTP
ncbi:MAG: redoxin domain-containing protein, partial [Calditrichia bacterium]|nr:redoxin domain-containing protein [Calditrichia bacterium]